jgi:hypothetical protein
MDEINYWKLDKDGQKVYRDVEKFNKLFPNKKIYLRRKEYDMLLSGVRWYLAEEFKEFIRFKNVRIYKV